MDTAMDNRTDKTISSRNNKKRKINKLLTILNILLLIAAVVIAVMVLTGCSKEPENYPEAEALVDTRLNEIKTADNSDAAIKSFIELAGTEDEELLGGYLTKLRDFDYEILGSKKDENDENAVIVTVRVSTYDFGNAYLSTWKEFLEMDEYHEGTQNDLFMRSLMYQCTALNSKDFLTDVDVVCTDPDGSGNYETDLKSNDEMMNAISGGMMEQIKLLAEEEKDEKDDE
ncbi:MAG: hypothetical protein J6D07_01000 [Mogibacterium sp.]|nr:hypothetical protein [Mogibacterium sp.]